MWALFDSVIDLMSLIRGPSRWPHDMVVVVCVLTYLLSGVRIPVDVGSVCRFVRTMLHVARPLPFPLHSDSRVHFISSHSIISQHFRIASLSL